MQFIIGIAALLILVPAVLLLLFFPTHPKTQVGWVIWTSLGIPLTLVAEILGEKVFSDKVSTKIDSKCNSISVKRIFYGIVIAIMAFSIYILIVQMLPVGLHNFINEHFSDEW